LGYILGVLIMATAFVYTMATRIPVEVNVQRDRNALFRFTSNGELENAYTLKINNMGTEDRTYRISVSGDYEFDFKGDREVLVKEGEVRHTLVKLRLDPLALQVPNADIEFTVEATDDPQVRDTQDSRFIGPR
ncbi:MAG: cytochrome c oxidase accessory protein CcoG, partial [Porticoccaceae bacterium]|nr:cytochrome c oxidase accessory protein CcoG [Porticoccaceae bacterium]